MFTYTGMITKHSLVRQNNDIYLLDIIKQYFFFGTPAKNDFNANCLRPYRSDMVSGGERRKPKKKTMQHEQIEIIVHIQLLLSIA